MLQGFSLSKTLFMIAMNVIFVKIFYPVIPSLSSDSLSIYIQTKNHLRAHRILQNCSKHYQVHLDLVISKQLPHLPPPPPPSKHSFIIIQKIPKTLFPPILPNFTQIPITKTVDFLGIRFHVHHLWLAHAKSKRKSLEY